MTVEHILKNQVSKSMLASQMYTEIKEVPAQDSKVSKHNVNKMKNNMPTRNKKTENLKKFKSTAKAVMTVNMNTIDKK